MDSVALLQVLLPAPVPAFHLHGCEDFLRSQLRQVNTIKGWGHNPPSPQHLFKLLQSDLEHLSLSPGANHEQDISKSLSVIWLSLNDGQKQQWTTFRGALVTIMQTLSSVTRINRSEIQKKSLAEINTLCQCHRDMHSHWMRLNVDNRGQMSRRRIHRQLTVSEKLISTKTMKQSMKAMKLSVNVAIVRLLSSGSRKNFADDRSFIPPSSVATINFSAVSEMDPLPHDQNVSHQSLEYIESSQESQALELPYQGKIQDRLQIEKPLFNPPINLYDPIGPEFFMAPAASSLSASHLGPLSSTTIPPAAPDGFDGSDLFMGPTYPSLSTSQVDEYLRSLLPLDIAIPPTTLSDPSGFDLFMSPTDPSLPAYRMDEYLPPPFPAFNFDTAIFPTTFSDLSGFELFMSPEDPSLSASRTDEHLRSLFPSMDCDKY